MVRIIKAAAVFLALTLILWVQAPLQVSAQSEGPATSGNYGNYEYTYARWATPICSYLVENADGTCTRVEYTGQAVTVETYSENLTFLEGFTIDMELPIFGGFYAGEDYRFLIFGQENPTEDDSVEVIRIVCYTQDWQRVNSASLYGANTTIPFDAGSLRCAEYNGYLYIRTAHEMYASNGVNHQANLTLNVRIRDMEITEAAYQVWNVSAGYVSHSFNQFIAVDGTDLVAVDHGDAHPRSVVLIRYHAPAGQDRFLQYPYCEHVDVLPIVGATGANDTGVSLGGFQVSDSAYLIAGNTVAQVEGCDFDGQRNIFISVTDKQTFSAQGTQIRYLTNYAEGDQVAVSNPHFLQVAQNKFAILWTEGTTLRYAFVDGNGNLLGTIYSTTGALSDCQPIVYGGKLVWYVTSASRPSFFTIDLASPENVTREHVLSYTYLSYPSQYRPGSLSSSCIFCGEAGNTVTVPQLGQSDDYSLYGIAKAPTCTETGSAWCLWDQASYYGVPNYIFSITLPPTGHSCSAWSVTTPATLTTEGLQEGICTGCGTSVTESIPCLARVDSWGLCLGSDLRVKFQLAVAPQLLDTAQVEIQIADETHTYPLSGGAAGDAEGMYQFFLSVAPAQINDTITICLRDGNQVSTAKSYTVADYCRTVLADSSLTQYHALVKALLNYGAAAQAHFGHNTSNPANDGITGTALQALPSHVEDITVSGHVDGLQVYGASLVYRERIAVRMYFEASGSDYTFTCNGKTYQAVRQNGLLCVEIPDIPPQNLDQILTVTANGTMTVSYSPLHYMVRMQNNSTTLHTLLKALYNYHLAAKQL